MSLRDRFRLGEARQRQVARLLQLTLVGFVFVGVYEGSVGVAINAGVALLVAQLPAVLERNYDITMDPRLVLWLTAAVFLHALGTLGLPGTGNLYQSIGWWDHLTHVLSSSVVAGAGYASVRALDEHVPELHLPPSFTFAAILITVVAFGVVWEVLEFAIGLVADAAGTEGILTQYGLEDTMMDLIFDICGGLLVAVWGTAYLADVASQLSTYLDTRRSGGL